MDVRQPDPFFPILLTLGLLAASAVWSPALSTLQAQEGERDVRQERERAVILHQEREQDCHCVDGEGEAIENCRCFRMPDMPDLSHIREQAAAWTLPGRSGGWIGVSVDREQEEDDRRGVRLREVMEDSPAWEGGLRSGDLVLTVDGRSVLEPFSDDAVERRLHPDASPPVQRFLAIVRELEPGEEIEVEYQRDGEERVARLTPGDRPGHGFFGVAGDGPRAARILSFRGDGPRGPRVRMDPCFTGSGSDEGIRGFRFLPDAGCVDGIRLQELNPELGAYFGGADGVLVTEVHEGASLGLEAGDVLVRIGEREVREPEDVRRILRSYGEDEELTLRVRRRGEVLDVLGTRRPPE